MAGFSQRFPGFNPEQPAPDAQAWLLERFAWRLHVQTMPRTLLVEIRFRSRDAALSAAVVNALIRAYQEQETESQIQATAQASGWLNAQLADLKTRVDRDQQRLADFEAQHGIVSTPEVQANGQPGETEHASVLLEIDELSRQLVAATTDRILTEAEYRAASQGDPEMVIAADPRLQAQNGNFATALLEQIHARRSDLEQEQAQLSAEHGPSFPRVVEIGRQLQDLDRQKQAEDAKLDERFRSNWQTALDREQLVRKSLEQATSEGMKLNEAATEYAVMRQEANASHDLYVRVLEKSEEAGLAAGVHSSNISVVDAARQPVKPVAPDLPLYLAITFFAGLWIAVGAALLRESLANSAARTAAIFLALLAAGACIHAQPPTPSTSGLPSGVVNIPQSQETRSLPNPKEAPTVWNNAGTAGVPPLAAAQSSSPMPAPIASGDFLDISEYHTPEFHSTVRVSAAGTVTLPMIGEVNINGMDEQAAAHAIEAALAGQRHAPASAGLGACHCLRRTRRERPRRSDSSRRVSLHLPSSAARPDLRRLRSLVQCRPPRQRLSFRRSQNRASGGARSQRHRHCLRSQSRTQPRRHRAGEPRRSRLCGRRRDSPRRFPSRSRAGPHRRAGALAGLGPIAECRRRSRRAHPRSKRAAAP